MKGEFYKMDFRAWNTGTVDLTLEQEAAYLRLCHAMYDAGGPIPDSTRLLQGIFRCGNVKAAALVRQLIEAGKIGRTADGKLTNRRVTKELSDRERLSEVRRTAGGKGGSAKREMSECGSSDGRVTTECGSSDPGVNAECGSSDPGVNSDKSLETNDTRKAIASTPISREEKRRRGTPKVPKGTEPEGFAEFWAAYPRRRGDNPRKTALPAYTAALRRGATHVAIMAGVRRYAAHLAETGKTNTEFVAQASTWLNQDRFELPSGQSGPPSGQSPDHSAYLAGLTDDAWRQHVLDWKRTGGQWLLKQRTTPPDDPRTAVPHRILDELGIPRPDARIGDMLGGVR